MQQVKVIALVGMPGAGKSTCVDYLAAKGIPKVYFGGVIVDEAKQRFGEANEKTERQVREELRAHEGMGAVATRVIPKIDELLQHHQTVIADGLYSWSEFKILHKHYGKGLVVIAVAAPRQVRHERLAKRPVRPLTEEEAMSREYAEIEHIEKGGPIAFADYTLVNDNEQDNLIKGLDKLLQSINFAA